MTIRDAIEKVKAYHVNFTPFEGSCDTIKHGDPDVECTGIVTTCAASVNVIREAAKLGANLIICHEPVFHSHFETVLWEKENLAYSAKKALLDETGIVIWRDHDHIHTDTPDGIFYGVVKELGWDKYLKGEFIFPYIFDVPDLPAREMALCFKNAVGMNAVRVIGNPDAVIKRAAISAHMSFMSQGDDMKFVVDNDIDLLIPGETIDFSVLSYFRDAGQLGLNKALLQVGHFNLEELGMKYAINWLLELFGDEIPVSFVPSADMYDYIF